MQTIETTDQLRAAHLAMCDVRNAIIALGDQAISPETWLLNKLLSAIDAAGQRLIESERLDAWLANQGGNGDLNTDL